MNQNQEKFFSSSPQEITQYLLNLYKNQPEEKIIQNIISNNQTIIELPSDFEPYIMSKQIPLEKIINLIQQFDYIILYHGTSTIYEKQILKQGILPREQTGNSSFKNINNVDESLKDSTYFGQLNHFGNIFDSVKDHALNNMKLKGGNPLIIRTILPINQILPDEDIQIAKTGISSIALGGTCRIKGKITQMFFPYEIQNVKFIYDIEFNSFEYRDFK